ncbi:MAG: hypothetical protein QOJ65_799 [Fimbriimonadaceae bacterium]|nr:hypothetical protein [Fimbriimonadaceae bacterium]
MKIGNRIIAAFLAGVMALGFVLVPAQANAEGRQAKREREHRVAASVLGAAGLYFLSRKQTTIGAIALAGGAYEAKRMQDEINNRHRRARINSYYRGYRNGSSYAYSRSGSRYGSSYRSSGRSYRSSGRSYRSSSRRGSSRRSTHRHSKYCRCG